MGWDVFPHKYWLYPRPDSDVMLMRLVWDGERCSGGVRQPLPESSSPLGTTSSPIRTLSRLPSSTPLPSHRPHGNLEGRQQGAEGGFLLVDTLHLFLFPMSLLVLFPLEVLGELKVSLKRSWSGPDVGLDSGWLLALPFPHFLLNEILLKNLYFYWFCD